jgi:hypothetical protein
MHELKFSNILEIVGLLPQYVNYWNLVRLAVCTALVVRTAKQLLIKTNQDKVFEINRLSQEHY